MTEGVMSYEGLAVPLFGESEIQQQSLTADILTLTGAEDSVGNFLTCQKSDGTEVVEIQDDGRVRITRRGTFSEALNAWYYCVTGGTAAQEYGAAILLDEETTSTAGGRRAVLNLRMNKSTAVRDPAMSYINFNHEGEHGVALFTFTGHGAVDAGGPMETTTSTATHGLVIYFENVKYWILCTASS